MTYAYYTALYGFFCKTFVFREEIAETRVFIKINYLLNVFRKEY